MKVHRLALLSIMLSPFPCLEIRAGDLAQGELILAAVVDDFDRRTEKEFATEHGRSLSDVQVRYAATGRLDCPSGPLSANLTLDSDLITTVAHGFVDSKTCVKHTSLAECKFVVRIQDQSQQFDLLRLEDTGYICPPALPDPTRDWAIIRLKKAVKGIAPFSVDTTLRLADDQGLTTVFAQSVDFWRNENGKRYFPKSIGICRSKRTYYSEKEEVLVSTDCDAARGASGGAILSDVGRDPILIGIMRGGHETIDQLKAALARGRPNSSAFSEGNWASYFVPLRGSFLRALLKAALRDEKAN